MLNMALLAGLVGYACRQGWMQAERVRRAVDALKGVTPEPVPQAQEADGGEDAPDRAVRERLRLGAETEEAHRIDLARREREIRDGLAQLEALQLALLRSKEAFEAEKRAYAEQRERRAKEQGDSGLQKELETLSGIPAKDAKELLRAKDDADVARIFMAMDQRKLNKIVKACKTSEDRLWIGRVLEKLHDSDAP